MKLQERIVELINQVSFEVYEKEEIFRLAMLAILGNESIFLLGKPGIAKSLISRRMKFVLKNGTNFEYLMNKFSTPEEIYGPIDIKQLQEGKYVRVVDGYLPTANIGFLDEIWKAGPSIQNTLLTIINEKIFRNGGRDIRVPLRLLISASNELPAPGEGLEALYDRFIIRYIAHGLKKKENFENLLEGESSLDVDVDPDLQITEQELIEWSNIIKREVKLSREVLDFINFFRQKISLVTHGKSYISDRRWKKIAGLIKTSAFFNERMEADIPDLFIIPYCIWDDEKQEGEYRKIFLEAFLEKFASEWRSEKRELLNSVELLTGEIDVIESQYLRLTPHQNIFKGKVQGLFYKINYLSSNPNEKSAFINADDWNKLASVPDAPLKIDVYFGPTDLKYAGSRMINAQYHKGDKILFVDENQKYFLQNDNPTQYGEKMTELDQKLGALEEQVKQVSAKLFKAYKRYSNMTCIFFEDVYYEKLSEAFDIPYKKDDEEVANEPGELEFNDNNQEDSAKHGEMKDNFFKQISNNKM